MLMPALRCVVAALWGPKTRIFGDVWVRTDGVDPSILKHF